jgi:predicted Zn-dependent peptidase
VGGDTYEPEKLKNRLIDLLSHISDIKIDEKDFMRNKKKNIGILINMFNSPESIANIFTRYYFEDIMAFDLIDAVNDLTIDDLYDLYPLFDQSLMSTFIVNPKN